jgi:hypothetical protein
MKHIIFNADDLGLSKLTDDGIIECARFGIVKSASLMVTSSTVKDSYKRAVNNGISVGLHLNVTSLHNFLSNKNPGLFGKEGKIKKSLACGEKLTNSELKLIIDEFRQQLDLFISMFGKLPDHINHHHPLYLIPGFTAQFKKWIVEIKVPTRWFRDLEPIALKHPNYTEFGFYEKENLNIIKLIEIIKKNPYEVVEIMTHPGMLDKKLESGYLEERPVQVKILTDDRLKEFLSNQKIIVTDFSRL